ncbi:MAG: hypothetical protein PSX81_06075 [bacterium]|nr:hypothetical protein [bacterium]
MGKMKISNFTIDDDSIIPALTILVEAEYTEKIEVITSISGRLMGTDGKTLALINEYQLNYSATYPLYAFTAPELEQHDNDSRNKRKIGFKLTANLVPQAINHIEVLREKNEDKKVRFTLQCLLKYLEIKPIENGLTQRNLMLFQKNIDSDSFEIPQSEWVKKYAPKLDVGRFLLLELKLPESKKVSTLWEKLYENLLESIAKMEKANSEGNWKGTIIEARQFLENIKFGDTSKPAHKKFRDEFSKLMLNDVHTQEGIDDFLKSIQMMFNFASKYIHGKDKDGNLKPIPNYTKEDAYFFYVFSIGIMNFIGQKISK